MAQEAPATPQKQIPLNRADMQLSFAPLVKETTPAVVNVYAARQVQARSPFAGDPFFEQFFGRSSAKANRASSNRWVPG
jgi:S1-C subfamily serine protease